ncbi:MAG: HipA N-terminal domain-containing protein [Oscillospiraceae bacterium]
MSELRTAYVYVREAFAGLLCETNAGYSFAYDHDYLKAEGARAVSLTLPLSEEIYLSNTLFPFFDGLIPEGWLFDIVTRTCKTDRKDRFGLLLAACKDSIGNVSIREART